MDVTPSREGWVKAGARVDNASSAYSTEGDSVLRVCEVFRHETSVLVRHEMRGIPQGRTIEPPSEGPCARLGMPPRFSSTSSSIKSTHEPKLRRLCALISLTKDGMI